MVSPPEAGPSRYGRTMPRVRGGVWGRAWFAEDEPCAAARPVFCARVVFSVEFGVQDVVGGV